ncbi:MAG: hypothetical protein J7647_13780 [Cyanobacteria bacterium SBLK]|nr:hypothetical protein [Cyanobacteria bacterium SBLK]
MLVILTDEQMLSPKQVCCNCLLADSKGLPRWRKGRLGCGLAISSQRSRDSSEAVRETVRGDRENCSQSRSQLPELYECQMGFRVAAID